MSQQITVQVLDSDFPVVLEFVPGEGKVCESCRRVDAQAGVIGGRPSLFECGDCFAAMVADGNYQIR